MAGTTYRVIVRRNQKTCDVEVIEPGAAPQIVNTFNAEAEAWEWVQEQQMAAEFCGRHPQVPKRP